MTPGTIRVPIGKVDGFVTLRQDDLLAVEEPLDIRLGSRSVSVTMRTPGHDCELAAGFLFAEGIISSVRQIRGIANSEPSIVVVELSAEVVIQTAQSQRGFVMTSALRVMRKGVLEGAGSKPMSVLPPRRFRIDPGVIHRLPDLLRQEQAVFGKHRRIARRRPLQFARRARFAARRREAAQCGG